MFEKTGVTSDDNLAENDRAGKSGQSEVELWMQKYNGIVGKLNTVQSQLVEAKAGLSEERMRWEADRAQLTEQTNSLQKALEGAQAQLGDITSKWTGLSAQAETLASQVARQRVMLEHPDLISEPIMKLVENSTLSAEDLAATLSAMAQSRQGLVKQIYQDAQTGSTPKVDPSTAQTGTKQEQAQTAWNEAVAAMQKGDMATYRIKYAEYLSFADKSGLSSMAAPSVMASQPMF